MKMFFTLILFVNITNAQSRTNLFKKEELAVTAEKVAILLDEKQPKKTKKVQHQSGNLPSEYLINKSISIEESPIVLPSTKVGIRFKDLKPGDLAIAVIQESLFAFQDSKSPVRALITSGILQGSVLIGEASLERNSKRILIDFKKFRDPFGKDIFQVQAAAMDSKGILGLEGKLVSNEGKYFAAEIIAAGAAGYADSTINRDQNSLGNSIETKSEDTFAKKALTAALSKTADRFSEKLKQAPEYSVLEGPVQIQILILDQPTLTQ